LLHLPDNLVNTIHGAQVIAPWQQAQQNVLCSLCISMWMHDAVWMPTGFSNNRSRLT